MKISCHSETEEILISIFAQANPIYAITRIISDPDSFHSLKEYLFPAGATNSRRLFTYLEKIDAACKNLEVHHKINRKKVLHVFPIVQPILGEGFMVPVTIVPGRDWFISDAFGTFGEPSDENTNAAFSSFLISMENAWLDANPGKPLPLRWRKAFAIHLEGSLHFNAIGGKSLQVPLAVAVLRCFAAQTLSSLEEGLPFGNNPVFSTGILNLSSGQFEPVDGLSTKLQAFVREYGKGLPAILTTYQQDEINRNSPDLMTQVSVITADNLTELMTLPELHEGLNRLCSPPLPTEIDHLLELMFKMRKSIRFKDMKQMIEWLRISISSPVYAFQLERNLGLVEAHRARFHQARPLLEAASDILADNPAAFGISEKIDLATAWGTIAVDACNMDLLNPFLKDIEAHIDYAKASDRAKYWGTICQAYRMAKEYDLAVSAGEKSVFFADMALASESGRDRNYLVHALLARAKNNPETKNRDLTRATALLEEARNRWAPIIGKQAHFGFCLHYQAEIARLRGQPFNPTEKIPWTKDWGHPWMFVLLSCIRNSKNSWDDRLLFSRQLIEYSSKKTNQSELSLFNLFHYIFSMYVDCMNGKPVGMHVAQIESWCESMKKLNFPGWQTSLMPFLTEIKTKQDPMDCVDIMCDHFFYF